jgi:hypothetical protein
MEDARKIHEHKGRNIFFDPYCHKYYCWDNGRKVYRVTKDSVIKYININF